MTEKPDIVEQEFERWADEREYGPNYRLRFRDAFVSGWIARQECDEWIHKEVESD